MERAVDSKGFSRTQRIEIGGGGGGVQDCICVHLKKKKQILVA